MVLVSVLATSACGLLVDASGLTGGGADAGGGGEPEADGPGAGGDATLDGAVARASTRAGRHPRSPAMTGPTVRTRPTSAAGRARWCRGRRIAFRRTRETVS